MCWLTFYRYCKTLTSTKAFWKLRFSYKANYWCSPNTTSSITLDFKLASNLITSKRYLQLLYEIITWTDSTDLFWHVFAMNGDVGSNSCNYIWCAVKHGRMSILKMLLYTNLKVNVHTVMHNPILLAVDLQKIDMLKMMLNYLDHRYIAPECVLTAIKANRIDILKLFDLTDSRIVAHKDTLLLECTSGEMLSYVQDSIQYTFS